MGRLTLLLDPIKTELGQASPGATQEEETDG